MHSNSTLILILSSPELPIVRELPTLYCEKIEKETTPALDLSGMRIDLGSGMIIDLPRRGLKMNPESNENQLAPLRPCSLLPVGAVLRLAVLLAPAALEGGRPALVP